MQIEQLVILAVVQGLTEFWPISSSGHLVLVPLLAQWPDQGPLIDVAVHVGSLFAVMIYFWRDMLRLLRGLADLLRGHLTADGRLLLYLILASIPLFLAGYALLASGAYKALRTLEVIAWANIVFALVLLAADRWGPRERAVESTRLKDALIVGLAQVVALIPGVSRSGITMSAARALAYERTEAARLAMLLAIPSILGLGAGAAFELYSADSGESLNDGILAAGLSFLAALLAIWFMMALLKRMSMLPFVLYRFALGGFLFVLAYG